jgi:hypothetical protein
MNGMKIAFLTTVLFMSLSCYAQQIDIPQKEFAVSLENESIILSPGNSKTIGIRILKSKSYQKGKVQMGLSSQLPTGITLEFGHEKGDIDSTQATITAKADALRGEYSIIVNATINYKTKGSILKISIH